MYMSGVLKNKNPRARRSTLKKLLKRAKIEVQSAELRLVTVKVSNREERPDALAICLHFSKKTEICLCISLKNISCSFTIWIHCYKLGMGHVSIDNCTVYYFNKVLYTSKKEQWHRKQLQSVGEEDIY